MAQLEPYEDEPQQSGPPPLETDEGLEEALLEYAKLEARKTKGEAGTYKTMAEKYAMMHRQELGIIERAQETIRMRVKAYIMPRLQQLEADTGKKTWKGGFGTVRVTHKKYSHEITDKNAAIEFLQEHFPHALTTEVKRTVGVARDTVEGIIKETGEVMPGIEIRPTEDIAIKPDMDIL